MTRRSLVMLLLGLAGAHSVAADTPLETKFSDSDITIRFRGQPLVTYVFRDPQIPRPYFKDLKTLSGIQVTRHHPPRPNIDPDDHALFHPGLWLAFGDLNSQDSWRLKAAITQVDFIKRISVGNRTRFIASNLHKATDGKDIARETYNFEFEICDDGWLLRLDSTFTPVDGELAFGDQEEMGLGVRLATPLAVKNGGEITNSHGDRNEEGCWGKAAEWCDYSGKIAEQRCGVLLMGHRDNFKQCSFHTRDYGFVAANPFAEKAFGRSQQPARTVVKRGESLRLQFGVRVYCRADGRPIDAAAEYAQYLKNSTAD